MDWYVTACWTNARQREKVLIFCQYGCVLILGPHSFSSLRYKGGKKRRGVTLVLPVSMATGIILVRGGQAAWWGANLGSLKSTLHEMPFTLHSLSLPVSAHHLCCLSHAALSPHHFFFTFTTIFYRGPVHIPTSAKEKPYTLERGTEPPGAPVALAGSHQESTADFPCMTEVETHHSFLSCRSALLSVCSSSLTRLHPSSLILPDRLDFITAIPDLLSLCI